LGGGNQESAKGVSRQKKGSRDVSPDKSVNGARPAREKKREEASEKRGAPSEWWGENSHKGEETGDRKNIKQNSRVKGVPNPHLH